MAAEEGLRLLREKRETMLVDVWLAPHGVKVASPRDPHLRGGHSTAPASATSSTNSGPAA